MRTTPEPRSRSAASITKRPSNNSASSRKRSQPEGSSATSSVDPLQMASAKLAALPLRPSSSRRRCCSRHAADSCILSLSSGSARLWKFGGAMHSCTATRSNLPSRRTTRKQGTTAFTSSVGGRSEAFGERALTSSSERWSMNSRPVSPSKASNLKTNGSRLRKTVTTSCQPPICRICRSTREADSCGHSAARARSPCAAAARSTASRSSRASPAPRSSTRRRAAWAAEGSAEGAREA
mmetsp:Transcript_31749/g.105178  ORF Transcript_31749/g.105178 Transcript_31749/m.105178 type:complete len:238 (-) Transcript_31749:2184-2897(-)